MLNKELSPYETKCITIAAHEANRQYCLLLGDGSHKPWDELSPELQNVAMQATVGIASNGHEAERSHAAWVQLKKLQGWTYGKVKNEKAKEHPCMVPFSELPPEQQVKDKLWIKVVAAMLDTFHQMPQ